MKLGVLAVALTLWLPAAGCSGPAPVTRIVLITLDTTRADRLGCYGASDAATANLDALARDAVLFEQAMSPAPTTLPAHTTMMTGLYPQDHGVRYNLFFVVSPEEETLAERLSEAGYATGGFPGAMVLARKFGIDQGFDTFVEPADLLPDSDGEAPGTERSAEEGVAAALAWLDGLPPERKTFLWLHFYDPHWPYEPPFPFSAEYRDRPYDGEIAYMDAQLGRVLERLRADGEWSRTLLIVAADHGEGLYEHEERWHHLLAYQTTQHVPLIIRAPGVRARREAEPVSLADIAPTILDLAGVQAPGPMRGVSLRPALHGRDLPRRDLYVESQAGPLIYGWAAVEGVRSGGFKLIDSVRPELYDLARDPAESENLAALEAQRVDELRAALEALKVPLRSSAGAVGTPQSARLDASTREMLESLGYVGGGGGSAAEGAPQPRDLIDMEPELLAAQSAIAAGRWEEVEELCRYALGRDPTNKWGLAQITRALARLGRPGEARDHAEILLRLYPDMEDAYPIAAEVELGQGRPARAHEILLRGLDALPDSERLSYLSLVAAFDAGLADVCSAGLPGALERYPRSGRLMLLRARCRARDGDAPGALAALEIAVAFGFDRLEGLEATGEFAEVVILPGFAELKRSIEDG